MPTLTAWLRVSHVFLSPQTQPVSQRGMSLSLQHPAVLVPDAGYGIDRGGRSPAQPGRNRNDPKSQCVGIVWDFGSPPAWVAPLDEDTHRTCVQLVLFQGFIKTKAMLELMGTGMEMQKRSLEGAQEMELHQPR